MKHSRDLAELVRYASIPIGDWGPVGTISEDFSAVIGREQWCFIFNGSNNYLAQYSEAPDEAHCQQWRTILDTRSQRLSELGIRHAGLVVPNKLTVLPAHHPLLFNEPMTATARRLFGDRDSYPPSVLFPVDELRKDRLGAAVFRRNDSHLTVAGNLFLVDHLLDALGYEERIEAFGIERMTHVGDLGSKFHSQLAESFAAPLWTHGALDKSRFQLRQDHSSASLTGTYQVIENARPAIDATLLIFGNSFFERLLSWGMTPWVASLFKATHFVWSPNVDFDLVNSVKPEAVIYQTCERFLVQAPDL